jgi:hypothetical protein
VEEEGYRWMPTMQEVQNSSTHVGISGSWGMNDQFPRPFWLKHLEAVNTHPEVQWNIMAWMTAWSFNTNRYPQHTRDIKVLEALEVQGRIGWTPFLEGCIAKNGWISRNSMTIRWDHNVWEDSGL